MNAPPLHNLSLATPTPTPTPTPTSAQPDDDDDDDGPVTFDDLGDDIVADIFKLNVEDGDITEICKKASEWCLGMGMGRPMCIDANDPQWERLCERVGWPRAATATPRRNPPTVGGEQFTWKRTFFSMCKAINKVNGTFPEAYGPDSAYLPYTERGRSWYRRMVKEQGKPQADQRQGLLERAVFEWSVNSADGRRNPPPVLIACGLAHGPYPWQTSPWEVNDVRANYQAADELLTQAVLATDYGALEAAIGAVADVDAKYQAGGDVLEHAIVRYAQLLRGAEEGGGDHNLADAMRIIQQLVREGADINPPEGRENDDYAPQGAANVALQYKCPDVFEFVFQRPDFDPGRNAMLVSTAAQQNLTHAVRLLLQHPKLVVYTDSKAVLDALKHRNVEMLRLLVEDGRIQLDVVDTVRELRDRYGRYMTVDALTLAVATGQTEAANILRAAGAPEERLRQWEIGGQEERAGELKRGLMQGLRSERLVALAESPLGPYVNDVDSRGNTPLILAVRFRYVEVVRALLAQEEIDLAVRNRDGRTALGVANYTNGKEIARLLRTAYAEP